MKHSLTRRQLIAGLAAGSVGLAGCIGEEDEEPLEYTLRDDFSNGLDDWDIEAHIGPHADLEDFEWSLDLTDDPVYAGDQAVSIFTEGTYDDGTVWIAQPIEVETERRYNAEVSFQAWSPSESFNLRRRAVAYLGQSRPTEEMDFPETDWNSTDEGMTAYGGLREPLDQADGWFKYSFEWESTNIYSDELWFAVGVTVVWETDLTNAIDDIDVHIESQ